MKLPIGRIVLAAVLVELMSIIGLVAVVALFGPKENVAAGEFARSTGQWFGPVSGALLTIVGGRWVARAVPGARVQAGLALGFTVAGIDAGLLLLAATPFQWLFVASNLGKVLAGALGGWFAGRGSVPERR
ncbi:MAG: hypothetical protein ABL977_09625 [Candidatus Eisenbacteria bacterium]